MAPMLAGLGFTAALLCAALMGLAIQRGSTCMVAAVEEAMHRRRPTKLAAIVEASLWVGSALLLLREAGALMQLPPGYPVTGALLAGATLLGLGAYLNRACVLGTVARLGSGEWAYAATPLGYFLGCHGGGRLLPVPHVPALQQAAPVLGAPSWLAWSLGVALAVRMLWVLRWRRGQPWSAHAATAVIAVTFVAMLLLAGAWAYTDVLADLARGMAQGVGLRALLAVALLGGALASGWAAGLWRPMAPATRQVLRCLAGGLLMGWGSLWIPGGNDGLVLIGMPLLWPYAWTAIAVMCATVAAAIALQRRASSI